jgi:hypothetical protein
MVSALYFSRRDAEAQRDRSPWAKLMMDGNGTLNHNCPYVVFGHSLRLCVSARNLLKCSTLGRRITEEIMTPLYVLLGGIDPIFGKSLINAGG